jgi:hypothetical protein
MPKKIEKKLGCLFSKYEHENVSDFSLFLLNSLAASKRLHRA